MLLDTASLLWDVVWRPHGGKSDCWHWVVRDPLGSQDQCLTTVPSARGWFPPAAPGRWLILKQDLAVALGDRTWGFQTQQEGEASSWEGRPTVTPMQGQPARGGLGHWADSDVVACGRWPEGLLKTTVICESSCLPPVAHSSDRSMGWYAWGSPAPGLHTGVHGGPSA